MSAGAIKRTQYWNVNTGSVRTGATGHGESYTDIEHYLLPLERIRGSALHSWGVTEGLEVTVAAGTPGLTVMTGSTLDASGRLAVLSEGGTVIVDQTVDADDLENIPTVVVGADGVTIPTTGPDDSYLLTLSWREVLDPSAPAAGPVLMHAPWLRIVKLAGFTDDGEQVVLAGFHAQDDGQVTALSPGPRRMSGVTAGRLELRVPTAGTIGQRLAAVLAPEPNGDLAFTVGAGTPPLRISAATGGLRFPSSDQPYEIYTPADGTLRIGTPTAGTDQVILDRAGNLTMGVPAGTARRQLHVEGTEIHTGGNGGGFSFADRNVSSFMETPGTGERWVWYSVGGAARLWSGWDRLTFSASSPDGVGLETHGRMRIRQAGSSSAGVWLHQDVAASDRGFMGMASDDLIGFYGINCGWGMLLDVKTGEVTLGSSFGRRWGAATLNLWGSQLSDVGEGTLSIRSGGSIVAFDGGDGVVIGSSVPAAGTALHVVGTSYLQGFTRVNGDLVISGNVHCRGFINKSGGGFRIDHPLDPANRYLNHSFVESPDMLNVYVGTAVTDEHGRATVELPGYFGALNRDHHFQLTPVGTLALTAIDTEVEGNSFTIRTDRPGVKVCWQVTGVRQDDLAEQNRLVVEEEKAATLRGRYLHPEQHGESAELSLFAALEGGHPDA
ncbi:hypothetical protein Acor_55330 [Acrocarpospora corrugata]|uniref:Uncharacterized protein n=1 Tax=Acrocarpospora corrugata TaxID=35763 RepID=A0A5M3W318_9ACTN|nr:hypothetical protein [Acrocarpospora corrugata]GES03467.1 hypothetical protein Acor_55330 [Acrocarpospora corrugata]